MKEKTQIKSLVLGAFLGAVVVFSVAAATTGATRTWEYRFLDERKLLEEGKLQGTASVNLGPFLNGAAQEGWEVVNYTDGDRGLSVLLRRVKR
jgi:hypothetical protein